MDGNRFDTITRELARGSSRRGILGAIGLGAAALFGRNRALAAYPDEDNCQKVPGGHCTQHIECCSGTCEDGHCPCGFKQSFCAGKCVDDSEFLTNPYNCGSCGHQCPKDGICVSGKCRCPEGTSECFGECVPGDPDRCECKEPCGSGCCPPDYRCCNEQCVLTSFSNEHCGACGVKCPEGSTCKDGQCVCDKPCGGQCCAPGQSCCDGGCCAAGQTCCGKGCCPDDYEVCCGGGDYCCPGGTSCFLGFCVGFAWLTSQDAAQASSVPPEQRIPGRPIVPPAPSERTTS